MIPSCGDTAAVVEEQYGPFDVAVPGKTLDTAIFTTQPRGLLRLHVMVDADNVCQDHVCFVEWGWGDDGAGGLSGSMYGSYVAFHAPRIQVLPDVAAWWAAAIAPLQVWQKDSGKVPGNKGGTRANTRFNAAWCAAFGLDLETFVAKGHAFVGVKSVDVHVAVTAAPWAGWGPVSA
jgi:hypothetical protein